MKNRVKKSLSLLLAVIMLLCAVPMSGSAAYENTYTNTGNQRSDIVGVAKTQVGNTNGLKYRSDGNSWCAAFVVWCARQAGIGSNTIKNTGWATADDLGVTYKGRNADRTTGINYTPQSGDLIIFDWKSNGYCYKSPASNYGDHVGIVDYVSNGYVYTIEGNSKNSSGVYAVRKKSYSLNDSEIKGYGIPNYSGSSVSAPSYAKLSIDQSVICAGQTITFTSDSDTADHYTIGINKNGTRILTKKVPHIFYYTCTEAGSYTAYVSAVNDGGYVDSNVVSWTVKPLMDFSGSFKVKASSKVIRKGPTSSYSVVKTVYSGDTVNVVGYTYNEVGNLWYKTDSGNFIFHSCLENIDGTALPSSDYLNATAKVMSSSKSVWSYPNGKTDPVSELKSGDIVNIIGYLYNEYGTLWYELSDGTYVNSSYLKFITSNIRTPSNYYINTYKVIASEKTLKSDPYSSSDTTRVLKKGDTVTTVFYMYNRYGNLWYMTDNYDFIYESYLVPKEGTTDSPSVYCYRSFDCNTDKVEQSEPYAVATTIKTISKNSRITTIGYVINLYGNKWYETDDGTFIYESELTCAHTYDSGKITTAATCKSTGVKTYTCTVCKATKTETIAKNPSNHVGGTSVKNAKTATCTAKGYTGDTYCLGCGVVTAKGRDIAIKAHTYDSGKITTAATCKSTGVKTYTCTVCKATKTETIAKNPSNHVGGTSVKNAKAATCTAKGYTGDTYCLGCGVVTAKGRDIAIKAHTYDSGKITTAATCKSTGVKTYTCTVCKATKTETIAKNPSNHVGGTSVKNAKTATCTAKGYTGDTYCLGCGVVTVKGTEISATGHTDSNNDGKCDTCGTQIGTPDTPETPEKPSQNCTCNCHKKGIAHFFYLIARLFWKMFKTHKYCSCGVAHY